MNLNISNLISEAILFHKNGLIEKAHKNYKIILKEQPENTEILKLIGIIELESKNFSKSVEYLNRAIESNKNIAELFSIRGVIYLKLKQYDNAIKDFEKTIKIDKNFKDAYFNLGAIFKEKRNLIKALNYFEKVTFIDPKNKKAFSNKAFIKIELRDFKGALSDLNKAIEHDPNYINAYLQRGNVHKELKLFNKSLDDYNKVLSFNKSQSHTLYNEALFNKSQLCLLTGNFNEGWKLYENRFLIKDYPKQNKNFLKPVLESLDGLDNKTILILGEQGIGDNIQFSRYLPLLKKKCSKIVFQVDKKMRNFFEKTNIADEVYSLDKNILNYDFYSYLMSLPFLFKTTLSNIPKSLLNIKTDKQNVQKWNLRFKTDARKLKIGINWEANKNIPGRSIPLKFFHKLSLFKNLNLYSLQKNHELNQIKKTNIKITEFDNFDNDGLFFDTISLINNLDLIITTDTSIAHLGGSMNKKTWVLLNDVPEWRWKLNTDKSYWYESITLFRCKKKDDWATIFNEIENRLLKLNIN